MNSKNINDKIKEINAEDVVWVIYLGIIFLSFYSNSLERKYYINNDLKAKEKYQKIIITIFIILFIVYIYFLKGAIKSIKQLKPSDSEKRKNLVYLSFIASLLLTISGALYLYIALVDNDLDVELAFN